MIWWSLIVVCYAVNLRDTTLSLEELEAPVTKPISLTGKFEGKFFYIYPNTADLVSTLRPKIEKATGIPAAEQKIIFKSNELDDNLSLDAYSMKTGHVITVERIAK